MGKQTQLYATTLETKFHNARRAEAIWRRLCKRRTRCLHMSTFILALIIFDYYQFKFILITISNFVRINYIHCTNKVTHQKNTFKSSLQLQEVNVVKGDMTVFSCAFCCQGQLRFRNHSSSGMKTQVLVPSGIQTFLSRNMNHNLRIILCKNVKRACS